MKIPTAGEIMEKGVYSTEASASLVEASQQMLKTGASLLLVTDGGKPVGVLSSGEMFNSFCLHVAGHFPKKNGVKAEAGLEGERQEAIKRRALEFGSMKVHSIMTPRVKTIGENEGIDEAVRVMKTNGIRRLMVANSGGKLVGVLTRNKTLCMLMEALSHG